MWFRRRSARKQEWHKGDLSLHLNWYRGLCFAWTMVGDCDTRQDDPPVGECCKACLKLLAKEQ